MLVSRRPSCADPATSCDDNDVTNAFDENVARVVAQSVSGEPLASGWFHVHVGEGLAFGGFLGCSWAASPGFCESNHGDGLLTPIG